MKVLTFSRHFPKGHPKAGQPTWFVEKIFAGLAPSVIPDPLLIPGFIWGQFQDCTLPKHHTIRAGSRFKPGDMASLRVWSDKPYRSKQVEFAQVEVKKVWSIEIVISHTWWSFRIDDKFYCGNVEVIANNDGLELQDFIDWFTIHPKSTDREFKGQVICWNNKIEY
jgi:hypothetical protein